MKSFYLKSVLILISIMYYGCSTQPKITEEVTRLPQSSMFEESEVFSDDVDSTEALLLDEQEIEKQDKHNASHYFSICKEPKVQELKVGDRVVTQVDSQPASGTLKESYERGTIFIVATDYGPKSTLRKLNNFKRTSQQISKAMDCVGMKSKKVYGLFKVEDKYYTGHVREVYKNGVVRLVNDRFKEQFSNIADSNLEIIGSKLKNKAVLVYRDGKQIRAEIRRVFEKDVLLLKDGKKLFIRKISEVAIQD